MRRRSDIFFIAMLFCLALVAFFAWTLKDNVDKKVAKQIQAKKQHAGYSIRNMHNAPRSTQYEIAGMGGDDGRIVSPAHLSVIPAHLSVIPAPTSVIPAHPPVIPAKAGIQKGGRDVSRK